MLKSLSYYWRNHLAVALATAITSAILAGALLVGDSLRGSLRAMINDRLGNIDSAVLSQSFFREALASELEKSGKAKAAPAILLNGSAVAVSTGRRVSQIGIHGINAGFSSVFGTESASALLKQLQRTPDLPLSPVVINSALQRELGVKPGEHITLSFEKLSEIHRESLLASRDPSDSLRSLRLIVTAIVPDQGVGGFSLQTNQASPRNAFVALETLQRILEQKGRANAVYSSGPVSGAFQEVWQPEDAGFTLRDHPELLIVESRDIFIKPDAVQELRNTLEKGHLRAITVSTNLANRITARDRQVPYSVLAALEQDTEKLRLTDGTPAPDLKPDEILINDWATKELQAVPGDSLKIEYYAVGQGNRLETRHDQFRIKGIVRMEGPAADPALTPEYPGISDADSISDWSPPFPVHLEWIRPQDEDYWDAHRGTPKAFVSMETAGRLGSSRFGTVTSLRITPPPGTDLIGLREQFTGAFQKYAEPTRLGIDFLQVKQLGLNASQGSTDFGMLFIGFSLFLIVSAVILTGLLYRLNTEQRSHEIGLLLAAGYTVASVRRKFLMEGALVSAAGSISGMLLATVYASLLIGALRNWWIEAIGTPFISLHVSGVSLAAGALIAFLICTGAIVHSIQRLSRKPVIALLARSTTILAGSSGSWARRIAFLAAAAAIVQLSIAVLRDATPGLFFGAGFCLLASGLGLFAHSLTHSRKALTARWALLRMSARNAERNPGRSLLSAALVSSACFIVIAVAANRKSFGTEDLQKESGTGGFSLIAESDVPIYQDLNRPADLADLGFNDPDGLAGARIYSLRLQPGDDISCLNLYRPQKPRVAGVPPDFIRRAGFTFQQTAVPVDEPWKLLEQEEANGIIPAIGDFNSVQWILHKKIGDVIEIKNGAGQPVKLKLTGLLKESVFQSELLISEKHFLKHFPDTEGFSYFLIDAPVKQRDGILQLLEKELGTHGFDAEKTETKLSRFKAVENTYLSTFLLLGGLGLLLGTAGLGIILMRNVIERRGELATLRAFGYNRSALMWMVLTENGFLLATGMGIGVLSALISVAPYLFQQNAGIPWEALAGTLISVFVTGMAASIAAVFAALRTPLLPALKAE